MVTTDPIADMLIRIKNASAVKKETVFIPYSRLKMSLAMLLEKEGYLLKTDHRGKKAKKIIEAVLLYDENKNSKIINIRRVSKLSARAYISAKELFRLSRQKGIFIISTHKGLLTAKEAKKENIGGEILCHVW